MAFRPMKIVLCRAVKITVSTDSKYLSYLIGLCREGYREHQEELYLMFYNYAMSICLRYSRDREEAVEIVNDGFVKLFSNLDRYKDNTSFKSWLRRILINASIDYYRRNEKHYHNVAISYAKHEYITEDAINKISEKEIVGLIQELPPSYRVVFNLFVIEGFNHREISDKLGISIGTSKSNLAIARSKLKRELLKLNCESILGHG
jgi:RNA polymerase sigma-70 factor (ECF subfamily)